MACAGETGRDSTKGGGGIMTTLYRDRWIECTDDAVHIHGYYFPWGTKRVPYSAIRTVRRCCSGTDF